MYLESVCTFLLWHVKHDIIDYYNLEKENLPCQMMESIQMSAFETLDSGKTTFPLLRWILESVQSRYEACRTSQGGENWVVCDRIPEDLYS